MFKRFSFARLGRELTKIWPMVQVFLISAAIIAAGYGLSRLLPPAVTFIQKMVIKPDTFISFAKNPQDLLKNTDDRTNILLLGIRGGSSGEGMLTDSMMIISYDYSKKNISLISIPRDIWVDSMKAKINTAYYYGELKEAGKGLDLAKSVVAEITNLPVHYGFILNFEGFIKAIDLVGGIDVNVERVLDDYKYPVPGLENAYPESTRYEHLHFDPGLQSMDGETALKFVRSRNADGEEGTDFARDARQQKIISAFQNKIMSQKTLLDSEKISSLIDIYHQYIVTDISNDDYGAFAKIILLASQNPTKNIVLSTGNIQTGELGILENPKNRIPYQGQYVLIPRDNNLKALHQYIQNELSK